MKTTTQSRLARIRHADLSPSLAAQVYVVRPPYETPTGRYLGTAHFQRLLREAPSKTIGRCLSDDPEPVTVDASDRAVSERLAAYDVVAVPVIDEVGRLVGAITVDDILDRLLPSGWR